MSLPQTKKMKNPQNTKGPETFQALCKFQFASDEAIGVGGKCGMRKEGQGLEGTKEERGVQANEEEG